MYIEPNSTIHILRDVHIDMSYEHTIWFDSLSAQYNYFHGKAKYTYSRQYYQRHDRGIIRLQQNANELFDCNYLMFQNISYGPKWFYAFITDVEYINDTVCAVHYEIDDMQTWFFNQDCTVEPCFVVREHSVTDEIGVNLVPEDVNLGEYIGGIPYNTDMFTDWRIVLVTSAKISNGGLGIVIPDGGYWGGIYGCVEMHYFTADATGLSSIHAVLNNLGILNKSDIVLAMYMCPAVFLPANSPPIDDANRSRLDQNIRIPSFELPFLEKGSINTSTLEYNDNYKPFDGYVPKNNKLYTYPYNYFVCYNNQGDQQEFKFEYFKKISGSPITFELTADAGTDPSIMIAPLAYLNKYASAEATYNCALTIRNFPKCAWATNDFVAKLVQGGINLALLAATHGASAFVSGGVNVSAPINPAVEPNYNLPQLPSNDKLMVMPHKYTPPISANKDYNYSANLKPFDAIVAGYIARSVFNAHASSKVGSPNAMYTAGYFDFTFKQISLAEQFAIIVDDYFNCYGYATNRVKTPNTHSRPHWNYVKTANCNIHGGMPSSAIEHIQTIFNNGITFWKNGEEVGDYTLDNRPVITP